jgi:hypothetical protein
MTGRSMGLFDRLFARKPASVAPLFFRVVLPGKPAPTSVNLDLRWSPSGVVESKRVLSAAGLCILPWRRGAEALEVTVRFEDSSGELAVSHHDTSSGRAHRVTLRTA